MRQLPITESWNEAIAFVSREAGLLFPVAFALIALPGVVFQFFAPEMVPGAEPQVTVWMLGILPVLVLSLLGTLALTTLALRAEVTVGEALAHAMRRLLPALGAALLLAMLGFVIAIPFGVVAALVSGGNMTAASAIMLPLVAVAFIVLGVRMLFINPVAATEPAGPIAMIQRSWALTRGRGIKLFAFLVLVLLVAIIASAAVTLIISVVVGFTIGLPAENDMAKLIVLLVSGLLNTVYTVYLVTVIARLYAKAAAD